MVKINRPGLILYEYKIMYIIQTVISMAKNSTLFFFDDRNKNILFTNGLVGLL